MTNSVYTYLRRNITTTITLLPFMILALLGALLLFQQEGAVSASQLFQSPVSPAQEPAPPPKPTPEKVLPPTVPPRPATETPVPVPTTPQEVQPPAPVEPPERVQPAPSEPEQLPAPTEPNAPPEIVQPQNPVQPPPVNPGQSEIVVDSGLLIDSVLVYLSYAWLCCGVIIFIMIPILFLVLYVWGSQRARSANM